MIRKMVFAAICLMLYASVSFATETLSKVPEQYQGSYLLAAESEDKGNTWNWCNPPEWLLTIKDSSVFAGDKRADADRIMFTIEKNVCYIVLHFPNDSMLAICQLSEGKYLIQQFSSPKKGEVIRYIVNKN